MATEASKESSNIKEYLLSIDDLGLPRREDMSKIEPGKLNSAIILITKLILLKKGTYPDHPDMGIDIVGRYRFSYESELRSLQDEIQEQCTTYLPELSPVQVETSFERDDSGNPQISILITVRQITYSLLYNLNDNTIEGINDTNTTGGNSPI